MYRGELKITARFDSATEEPQLPADLSKMQQTTDTTEMVYRYVFDGVHFHLKDGSWIVALNYRFRPRKGDEVLTDAAPKVDLAGLTAAAKNERPFDAEKEAATWLKQYEGDQRERVKEMMNLLVPVSYYIKAHADDWAVAFPLLQRAGWPDAAMSSLAMADFRARSYWQLRPWIEPDYLFDPTGQYPQVKESEAAWQKAHPKLKLEPVDVAFRRGLYRVIRAQFDADAPIVDAETAAACCLACLDPEDPQGGTVRKLRRFWLPPNCPFP